MALQKAYAALPEDAALIVCEAILDDDRRVNAFGLLMSLDIRLHGCRLPRLDGRGGVQR